MFSCIISLLPKCLSAISWESTADIQYRGGFLSIFEAIRTLYSIGRSQFLNMGRSPHVEACICVCVCVLVCVNACFQSLDECPWHGAFMQKHLCDDLIPLLSAGPSGCK